MRSLKYIVFLLLLSLSHAERITIQQGDDISSALLRANDNDEIYVLKDVTHGLVFVGPGFTARNVTIRGEDATKTFIEGVVWRNDRRIKGITFQNLYFYGTTEPYMFNWDFNQTAVIDLESNRGIDDLKVDACIFRSEPSPDVYEAIWPTGIFQDRGGYGGTLTFSNNLCGGATFLYYGNRPETRLGHDSAFSLVIDGNTLWHYSCKVNMQSYAYSHERLEFTNNIVIRPEGRIYAWVDSTTQHVFYGARHAVFRGNNWGYDVFPWEYKIRISVQSWETLEVTGNVLSSVASFVIADGDPLCPNTVFKENYMGPTSLDIEERWFPHVLFRCHELRDVDASRNFWGFIYGPASSNILSTMTGTRPNELPKAVGGFPWYIDQQMSRLAQPCSDGAGNSACEPSTEKCDFSIGKCICSSCSCAYRPESLLSPRSLICPHVDAYQPSSALPPQSNTNPRTPSGASNPGPWGPSGSDNRGRNDGATVPGGNGSNVGVTAAAAIGGLVAPFVILGVTICVARRLFATR